eukprot:SAG31_NODE_18470_length_635_cov_0.891791_1_plen_73_part_10
MWACNRGLTLDGLECEVRWGSLARMAHATGRKLTAYAVYVPVGAKGDTREMQIWSGLKSRAAEVERSINQFLY